MNPLFENHRKFECEDNAEFAKYMKNGKLEIFFIDESRELQRELRDYIGSAIIPLASVYDHGRFEKKV